MRSFVQLALNWFEQPQESTSTADSMHAPVSMSNEMDTTTQFQHPRANRHIRLAIGSIGYRLTRSRRQTIGMSVGPDGLDVRAPRWVSIAAIDTALLEKADWILRKLQEMQERHKDMQSTIIEWREGSRLPFLGESVVLKLDASHLFKDVGARLEKNDILENGERAHVLKIAVAQNANTSQIRDAVQAWLMQQAKQLFIERLDHFAPVLGVQWRKLSLSNASTRWGSAASDGSIRLNWRLVHFKMETIDYVVVHELSHLRVMDHSPMFWETVRNVVPDYAHRRAELKDEAIPKWV
ncbi:MAG: M48 family peptidase [Betaproteobacteria bacterium]|nr:M48 family peptidase [Betaproteobacteria bacterium]